MSKVEGRRAGGLVRRRGSPINRHRIELEKATPQDALTAPLQLLVSMLLTAPPEEDTTLLKAKLYQVLHLNRLDFEVPL